MTTILRKLEYPISRWIGQSLLKGDWDFVWDWCYVQLDLLAIILFVDILVVFLMLVRALWHLHEKKKKIPVMVIGVFITLIHTGVTVAHCADDEGGPRELDLNEPSDPELAFPGAFHQAVKDLMRLVTNMDPTARGGIFPDCKLPIAQNPEVISAIRDFIKQHATERFNSETARLKALGREAPLFNAFLHYQFLQQEREFQKTLPGEQDPEQRP